jgi:hypothetical protein
MCLLFLRFTYISYIESNDMIMNGELVRIWKEMILVMGRLGKIIQNALGNPVGILTGYLRNRCCDQYGDISVLRILIPELRHHFLPNAVRLRNSTTLVTSECPCGLHCRLRVAWTNLAVVPFAFRV